MLDYDRPLPPAPCTKRPREEVEEPSSSETEEDLVESDSAVEEVGNNECEPKRRKQAEETIPRLVLILNINILFNLLVFLKILLIYPHCFGRIWFNLNLVRAAESDNGAVRQRRQERKEKSQKTQLLISNIREKQKEQERKSELQNKAGAGSKWIGISVGIFVLVCVGFRYFQS